MPKGALQYISHKGVSKNLKQADDLRSEEPVSLRLGAGLRPGAAGGFWTTVGHYAMDHITLGAAQGHYLVNLNHVALVGVQDHYQVEQEHPDRPQVYHLVGPVRTVRQQRH